MLIFSLMSTVAGKIIGHNKIEELKFQVPSAVQCIALLHWNENSWDALHGQSYNLISGERARWLSYIKCNCHWIDNDSFVFNSSTFMFHLEVLFIPSVFIESCHIVSHVSHCFAISKTNQNESDQYFTSLIQGTNGPIKLFPFLSI